MEYRIDGYDPKRPQLAINTFRSLFLDDHEYKNLKIEQTSIINYIMYIIAKDFNNNVFKLFDYDEILCYPYLLEMELYYGDERYDYNQDKFEPEHFYPDTEKAIEAVYQKLKEYIFNYIGKHESDIAKEMTSTKINAAIVNMQQYNFKERIEQWGTKILNRPHGDKNRIPYGGWDIDTLLEDILVPEIIRTPGSGLINEKYHDAVMLYAVKLLAAISEKLYYFILGEVKRIVDDNSNGIVDPNVQPVEEIKLPQQLVSYDDLYVQKMLYEMQQQSFIMPSNIYSTEPSPINVQPDTTPGFVNLYGDGNEWQNFPNVTEEINGRKVLSIDELQRRVNETAAAKEQSGLLEIDPALMESYNALDTPNRAIVGLFIQIILKNRNRAS